MSRRFEHASSTMSLMFQLLLNQTTGPAGARALGPAAASDKDMSNPIDNPLILLCHFGMLVEAIAFSQGDMFWLRVGLVLRCRI